MIEDRIKYLEVKEVTKEYVEKALNEYALMTNTPLYGDLSDVVNIGISILETKFPEIGPGYVGGSFVQAIVNNDLNGTFASADSTNARFVKFYCQLIYNFSPRFVL